MAAGAAGGQDGERPFAMPESPQQRLRNPTRKNLPHAGISLDPPMTRKGLLAHPGSIVIALAGFAFFAYAFNVGGLQLWVDSLLHGADAAARSHNSEVSAMFMTALPYIAATITTVVVLYAITLVFTLGKSLGGSALKKQKKKGSQKPVEPAKVLLQTAPPAKMAISAAPTPEVKAKPARAEFIRPARLNVREMDMKLSVTPKK